MTQSTGIRHLMRYWGPIVPVANEVYDSMKAEARLRGTLLSPSRIELSARSSITLIIRLPQAEAAWRALATSAVVGKNATCEALSTS